VILSKEDIRGCQRGFRKFNVGGYLQNLTEEAI